MKLKAEIKTNAFQRRSVFQSLSLLFYFDILLSYMCFCLSSCLWLSFVPSLYRYIYISAPITLLCLSVCLAFRGIVSLSDSSLFVYSFISSSMYVIYKASYVLVCLFFCFFLLIVLFLHHLFCVLIFASYYHCKCGISFTFLHHIFEYNFAFFFKHFCCRSWSFQ